MGEEEGDVWKRVAMRLHLEELGGKVWSVEADMHEVYCKKRRLIDFFVHYGL